MIRCHLAVSWLPYEIPAGLVETLCGDVRSRGLLACVLEADGCVLCKSVVQSVKLIDISYFVFDPS